MRRKFRTKYGWSAHLSIIAERAKPLLVGLRAYRFSSRGNVSASSSQTCEALRRLSLGEELSRLSSSAQGSGVWEQELRAPTFYSGLRAQVLQEPELWLEGLEWVQRPCPSSSLRRRLA